MNTLVIEKSVENTSVQSAITCTVEKTYLLSKESFLTAKAAWKSRTHHTATEIIAYNVLRGLPPDRGFTKLTTRKAASRYNDPWIGYNMALPELKWTLTKQVCSGKWDRVERAEKANAASQERFKKWFGIDLTDELIASFPIIAIKVDKVA